MENIGRAFDLTPVNLRRRRFLMVSVALLSVLGIALGVSFMATTGTATTTISGGGAPDLVFPITDGRTLPANVDSVKYGTTFTTTTSGIVSVADSPTWSPIEDSAGTLSAANAGDLALIDASSNTVLLSVYMTDLNELQKAYSSFAFVMNLYECNPADGGVTTTCDNAADWDEADGTGGTTAIVPDGGSMFTNTEGFLQFRLTSGSYYLLTLDPGGAYFTFDATPDNPDGNGDGDTNDDSDLLGPEWFFSAKVVT